jgi:hypothetical protein
MRFHVLASAKVEWKKTAAIVSVRDNGPAQGGSHARVNAAADATSAE